MNQSSLHSEGIRSPEAICLMVPLKFEKVRLRMSALESAHRGYEYQDLLVACRLVDVMLGSIKTAHVDEKLVPQDRFDDLTTEDETGRRERVQVKHTADIDRPLPQNGPLRLIMGYYVSH